MTRRITIIATIVLALAATACSPGSAGDSDGMTRHDGDGYTLLLPSDWVVLTADDPNLAELFTTPGTDVGLTPEMSAQVDAAFAEGIYELFAFDFDSAGPGFVNNLNLGGLGPLDMSAAAVLAAESAALTDSGAEDVSGDVVSYPAGDGYFMTYRMPIMGSLEAVAAGILGEENYWIITMVAIDADPYENTIRRIAESFQESP